MKRIRIDYYRFRLKKGRVDILLQRDAAFGVYSVPCHYVHAEERVGNVFSYYDIDDDGDLVFSDVTLNDCHLDKKDKEWVSLSQMMDLTIAGNESFQVWHKILRFFLGVCPNEGESSNIRKAEAMLEDVNVRMAKKAYLDWLQGLLDRKNPLSFSAHISPPDPELVRREMETLEHFRLYKPSDIPMTLGGAELLRKGAYSFVPVSLETFGCTIKHIPSNHLFEDEGDIEIEEE